MAREAMVTRSIEATKVSVLGLNIESAEPENKMFYLPGTFKDEKKLLNKVKKEFETDTFKIATVVDSEVVSTLYGMQINDFIKNAVILDPETRKPVPEVQLTYAE